MTRYVWLTLLIVAAAIIGLWTGSAYYSPTRTGKSAKGQPPVLVVDTQSLNIGEVWEDRAFKRSVKVENPGKVTVHVEGATCGCKGMSAKPDQFELAPGASRDIEVTLDLSVPSGVGPDPRPFAAPLRLHYSTPSARGSQQQSLGELRGSVKPVLLTTPVWNLGLHSRVSGPIEKGFEVVAVPRLAALDVDVPPNPWGLRVSVQPRSDRAGVYDAVVQSDAPTVSGVRHTEVTFRTTAVDGAILPPKQVTIEAEVAASDVRIYPAELCFGGARVGDTVESRVSVATISGREVRVEKVETVGGELRVTAL